MRKLFLLTCAVMMVFVNIGLGQAKSKPSYKWRLGTAHTEGPIFEFGEKFCEYVIKYSEGRIQIKNYPGDLLGDWVHQLESVAMGTQQFTVSWPTSTLNPKLDVTWVPYVVFNWQQALKATKPGGWYTKMLEPLYHDAKLFPFAIIPNQFMTTGSMKKIEPYTPENIKNLGLRTRVPSIKAVKIWADDIGFNSQTIPLSEVQVALKQGMVDAAACNDHQQIWDFRDLIKYEYIDKQTFCVLVATTNLKLWNSLSDEDKEIIRKASTSAINDIGEKFAQIDILDKIKSNSSVKVVEVSDEEIRTCATIARKNTWDRIEKEMLGKEIMDIIRANASPIP